MPRMSGFGPVVDSAPIAACSTVVVSLIGALVIVWWTIAPVAAVLIGGER